MKCAICGEDTDTQSLTPSLLNIGVCSNECLRNAVSLKAENERLTVGIKDIMYTISEEDPTVFDIFDDLGKLISV